MIIGAHYYFKRKTEQEQALDIHTACLWIWHMLLASSRELPFSWQTSVRLRSTILQCTLLLFLHLCLMTASKRDFQIKLSQALAAKCCITISTLFKCNYLYSAFTREQKKRGKKKENLSFNSMSDLEKVYNYAFEINFGSKSSLNLETGLQGSFQWGYRSIPQ